MTRVLSPALLALALLLGAAAAPAADGPTYANPIYGGQDPYVLLHDGVYYIAASAPGDSAIVVFKSDKLTDPGVSRTVYVPPATGPYSKQLWAPEIHRIDGQWYIYTCADDGDNANHRLIVLKADTDDPLGSYSMAAELQTPGWAIDESVFRAADGKLYCVWSGWPVDTVPDSTQHLFISRMASPTELAGPAVDISGKMHEWETRGRPDGLNEGPQPLLRDGRVFIVYACSGSWTADYALGVMECTDGDLLNPDSWVKQPKPAFSRTDHVYGPGHGCLTKSPDGAEDWLVYHSSIDPEGSWNRSVSIQRFTWTADGAPNFGRPAPWGTVLPAPSGEPANKLISEPGGELAETFDNLDRWEPICFFRRTSVRVRDGALQVRGTLDPRYGDKLVLRDRDYADFEAEVEVNRRRGDGAAGLLFRISNAAVGVNRYHGYTAQWTADNRVQLVRSNGDELTVLAEADLPGRPNRPLHLRVVAQGDRLSVYLDGARKPLIEAQDETYFTGAVGLLSGGVNSTFDNFQVRPL
ncbi:family 43 glycosylhydrolase [Posidoniimonas polymericola]|uniref:family 43 glycosylhydrolase n=1 Tax=Posidoniimonas polymericola TaxID=2528002 RepID=UPI001E2C5F8F|nr:family 43 glycosylhydrolase [Posidoniimonas polymericola]